VGKNFTIPLLEAFEARPSVGDSLRRTAEYLEPIIRLEAMIDARIDKALARLVSLKEYKRGAAALQSATHSCGCLHTFRQSGRNRKRSNNHRGCFYEMNLLGSCAP
jgi:hypothetical protein